MYFVTPDQFANAILRNVLCKKKEGYADPLIIDLVSAFNECEGIATLWSCSGHSPEELAERKFKNGVGLYIDENKARESWYIAFVLRPGGEYLIDLLLGKMSSLSKEDRLEIAPSLSYITLLGPRVVTDGQPTNAIKFTGRVTASDPVKRDIVSKFWAEIVQEIKAAKLKKR